MRKIISLILLISIIFSLSGCNNTTTEHIDNIEQTNKELKVYMPGMSNGQLCNVVESYKKEYPDVKLIVCNRELYGVTTEEELCQKISAEIMAGKGPDIFGVEGVWGDMLFKDVNKAMKSGVFYDLNQLFKEDESFNKNDYLEVAMKACEYEGKQYIFPTGIETPFFLTSKQTLENTNINLSKCKTTQEFTNQVKKYIENRQQDDKKSVLLGFTFEPSIYLNLLNVVDYEKQTIKIDTPEVKEMFEMLKLNQDKSRIINGGKFEHVDLFKDNNLLFYGYVFGYGLVEMSALMNETIEPVLYPNYNNKGKIQTRIATGVAINSSSPNKKNAYDFLKLGLDWKCEPYDIDFINEINKSLKIDESIPKEQYLYNCSPYLPTSKTRFEYDLEHMKKIYDEGYFQSKYDRKRIKNLQPIEIKPLPKEFYDEIRKIYYDIDVCTFSSSANNEAVKIMEPYIKGEKSYEECIKEAQSKLEIYISE